MDYRYYPEEPREITVEDAKLMYADIQAGKLTVDPRFLEILKRRMNEDITPPS